jgi:hypothetical protein
MNDCSATRYRPVSHSLAGAAVTVVAVVGRVLPPAFVNVGSR